MVPDNKQVVNVYLFSCVSMCVHISTYIRTYMLVRTYSVHTYIHTYIFIWKGYEISLYWFMIPTYQGYRISKYILQYALARMSVILDQRIGSRTSKSKFNFALCIPHESLGVN
ncbi:hypothetical protein KP509_27G024000 [Ceratopteris richardii]|uniref:Uncharacterized protein n=1 Tax=Ceratopteris richardii TaxID=49495 RepID=A0A8T2REQ0_CERRI|nr:hypothetical protein KP509_27G024000 [Ceratopteris richardii]